MGDKLGLAGRVVTGNAPHAQQETASCLLEECSAGYLITAVKAISQPCCRICETGASAPARQSRR